MQAKVLNLEGQEVGKVSLDEKVFGAEYNEDLIHQAVVTYLANQRQGTKSTLTRAEVAGGGRKPWRQKGTGRARQGSIRSPQWVHGGVVFAPKPRDYSFKMNKKEKAAAIKSVLTSKVNENKFIVLDELKMDEFKTKKMVEVLNNLKVNKALVVLAEKDEKVARSAKNIPTVATTLSNSLSVYEMLKYDSLVITKDAVAKIEEVYA